MNLPFIAAGERLDGDKVLAAFDYVLAHIDFVGVPSLTRRS